MDFQDIILKENKNKPRLAVLVHDEEKVIFGQGFISPVKIPQKNIQAFESSIKSLSYNYL